VNVDLLAYPNGTEQDFDERTVGAAAQSGYRAAVTTVPGWNHSTTGPYALRRFVMYPQWGPAGFGVVLRHSAAVARQRINEERSRFATRRERPRRSRAATRSSARG
jgi:hypothetical protein